MIPVHNTIHTKKSIILLEIEAHYRVDGEEYRITQRLLDPPVELYSGDTITLTWDLAIKD